MRLRGLILAGGRSTRFGSDKALAAHEGKGFLESAVKLLQDFDVEPVIVTRKEADYSSIINVPILIDQIPDRGPLGGIYTAMVAFRETKFLVLTCDMPGVSLEALSQILTEDEPDNALTVFQTPDNRVQPFPGIYSPELFPKINAMILGSDLSMYRLINSILNKKILPWNGEATSFTNINTPEEFSKL